MIKLNRRKSTTNRKRKHFQFCECGCEGIVSKGSRFLVGHGRRGKKSSPEHIRKISEALTGRPGLFGKDNHFYGKKHSDKSKEKNRQAHLGKKQTQETVDKRMNTIEANGGVWNKGKKMSNEFCKKISERQKGLPGHPCSEETKVILSERIKEIWKNPEHRKRVTKSLSGINHPFYRSKPGMTPENWPRDYPLEFNDKLKEMIRERDGRRCQLCTLSEEENRKLDIHHINYLKFDLDPTNLISLCHSCHGKTEHNRDKWQSFFMGRIRILNRRKKVA